MLYTLGDILVYSRVCVCLFKGVCVYPSEHSFFTAKYEILQLYPNSHSFFFHREIQNSTVVLKQSFVFPSKNTKFRILSFVPWIRNTKLIKLFRNGHLLFFKKLTNLKFDPNCHSLFWRRNTKCEVALKRPLIFDYKQRKQNLFI